MNASRLNSATPLAIVTSLNGIGVNPFRMMIQAPHCANPAFRASYLSIAW